MAGCNRALVARIEAGGCSGLFGGPGYGIVTT